MIDMKIKQYYNKNLNETVYCGTHSSGLDIRVLPKNGCDSAFAVFGVKFGSIDTFLKNSEGVFETIPMGTAHFLEHKLFESEELDAFKLFEKTGAYANAYTSFEKTAYLFKGSNNIEESLGYLLDFVQNPYFTAETVQKEQGIIGQEIMMYQDLPDWVIMFNLLKCLYPHNPVSSDIAGSVESIAQIDDKLLYRLYDTFYNPSNMCLSIVGNINPDSVFDLIEKSIKYKKKKVPERKFTVENKGISRKYISQKLSVGREQYLFGFKEHLTSPELSLKDEIASDILLETLFGKSSSFYKKLYDEELIDDSFGSELFDGFGFALVMIGGSGDNSERIFDLVKEEINKAKINGIDSAAFERAKKKNFGRSVMSYNDIDSVANLLMSLSFSGYDPFSEIETLKNITLSDIQSRLNSIDIEESAVSVILPL